MIGGMIALVTLIFIRLQDSSTFLALPENITIPNGTVPIAFTQTQNWYSIVTAKDEILIFDLEGKILQSITLNLP